MARQGTFERPPARALLILSAVAMVAAVMVVVVAGRGTATAEHLEDYPLRITYELLYQQVPDRSAALAEGRAVWEVTSPSEWTFSFVSGPDAGSSLQLGPDGTFTASNGRTTTSTKYEPGTEMVPLADMAYDTRARIALVGAPTSGAAVERDGRSVRDAVRQAAAEAGLAASQLRGAVLTRESSVDAFRYDAALDDWVGEPGTVEETVVVDTASRTVVMRQTLFEGQLIRRVVVVGVEPLGR